jgi:hypothetical protein
MQPRRLLELFTTTFFRHLTLVTGGLFFLQNCLWTIFNSALILHSYSCYVAWHLIRGDAVCT